MLRCPITYHHCFSKIPLQLLEAGYESDGVEPVVRPEELPAVQSRRPVYRDRPMTSRVWHAYPHAPGRPVLTAGHSVMHEEHLILHDYDKSIPFQARNSSFEAVPPVPNCLPVCSVDVYLLRYLWGQVVQVHDLSDVRDVKVHAGLRSYVLLQIHWGDAIACYICNHTIHVVSRNSSGPATSGKIPETLEASFVVTAQPVADPRGATYLEACSLIHGHIERSTMRTVTVLTRTLWYFSFLHVFLSSSRFMSSMHP